MPTYKNITTIKKILNNKVVEPNAKVSSPVYYNENDVGLLKTSDFPSYNPVLFSDKITKEMEVVIPEKDNVGNLVGKYALHFYVEEGDVTIWFNNQKNSPPLKLYSTARWNIRCFERTVNKVFVTSEGKFTLYFIVEKL